MCDIGSFSGSFFVASKPDATGSLDKVNEELANLRVTDEVTTGRLLQDDEDDDVEEDDANYGVEATQEVDRATNGFELPIAGGVQFTPYPDRGDYSTMGLNSVYNPPYSANYNPLDLHGFTRNYDAPIKTNGLITARSFTPISTGNPMGHVKGCRCRDCR
jgi:hypothetical protein